MLKAKVVNPKIKFLTSGKAVCNFGVGLGNKKQDGTWDNFILPGTAWGAVAERIAELDKKRISITEMSISKNEWIDKATGEKKEKGFVINVWAFDEAEKATPKDDDSVPF